MNEAENKDRWYVDIRGKISIMTTAQILKGLFTLEIKVINRISRNKENWTAICNEPFFEKLLKEKMKVLSTETFGETPIVQMSDLAQKESESEGLGIDVENVAGQISDQLEQAKKMQEVSVEITNVRRVLTDISINKKVVHGDSEQSLEVETLHPEDRDEYGTPRGYSKDSKAKLLSTARILFYGVCVVLIIVFGGMEVVERLLGNAAEKKKVSIAIEGRNKRLNEYSSAVGNFNGLVSQQPAKPADPTVVSDESDRFVAQFNAAIEYMQRGDFAGAEPLLLDTFKYPNHDRAPSVIALFEVALRLDQKDLKIKTEEAKAKGVPNNELSWVRVTHVRTMLDRINESGHPFEAELSLIRTSSSVILGRDWSGSSKFFIEQFPTESVREGAAKDLNYGRFFWANMCRWLVDSMETQRADALLNAVLGSCLMRSDQLLRAKPYIEYAYKKAPGDTSIQALAGYLLLVSGNLDEAKKILYKDEMVPTPLSKKSKEWLCAKYPTDGKCVKREPSSLPKTIEPALVVPPKKTAPIKRNVSGRRR